jgi:hypothetical protein
MRTPAANVTELTPKKMRYSAMLRCLGQCFEEMQLKALEIRTHGNNLVVQAWNRGTSMAMDFEKLYSLEDLRRLDAEGRAKRRPYSAPADLLSLSQTLRLAGNYVDRIGGRLLRVSWQDQSDRIQSLTVQWEPVRDAAPGAATAEFQPTLVEELCIHIYKQRKKINLASERQAQRPFVSVVRG